MKKRSALALGSLLMVYLMLGSSALALFMPQVSIDGVTAKTANFKLLVSKAGANPQFSSSGSNIIHGVFDLQPNMTPYEEQFWLKNDSETEQLDVSYRINQPEGDWDVLKDLVKIRLFDINHGHEGDWYTLAELAASAKPIPETRFSARQPKNYSIFYSFADVYPTDPDGEGPLQVGDQIGNELMGKTLTNLQIVFEGESINLAN